METPDLFPSGNTLGLEDTLSNPENLQLAPQPWLLCIEMLCQPAGSELEEVRLKMLLQTMLFPTTSLWYL